MNLYATITSERASKSQGGQEYIELVVLNKQRQRYAKLYIDAQDGEIQLENGNGVMVYRKNAVLFSEAKPQDTSLIHRDEPRPYPCIGCKINTVSGYAELCKECDNDIEREETKGEKQKDECAFPVEDSNYCDTHGTDKAH